jgi:hypothetical protein
VPGTLICTTESSSHRRHHIIVSFGPDLCRQNKPWPSSFIKRETKLKKPTEKALTGVLLAGHHQRVGPWLPARIRHVLSRVRYIARVVLWVGSPPQVQLTHKRDVNETYAALGSFQDGISSSISLWIDTEPHLVGLFQRIRVQF